MRTLDDERAKRDPGVAELQQEDAQGEMISKEEQPLLVSLRVE